MEALEIALPVVLFAAVFLLRRGRGIDTAPPDRQHGHDILARASGLAVAPSGSVGPVDVQRFRRKCNCNSVGCTL